MRNLQELVKKAFCYQKLFWPFTVWINCSSDLKNFGNSRPSALNFKSFSRSLEHFFLTVRQKKFGNKIPILSWQKNSSGSRFSCILDAVFSVRKKTRNGRISKWKVQMKVLFSYRRWKRKHKNTRNTPILLKLH